MVGVVMLVQDAFKGLLGQVGGKLTLRLLVLGQVTHRDLVGETLVDG